MCEQSLNVFFNFYPMIIFFLIIFLKFRYLKPDMNLNIRFVELLKCRVLRTDMDFISHSFTYLDFYWASLGLECPPLSFLVSDPLVLDTVNHVYDRCRFRPRIHGRKYHWWSLPVVVCPDDPSVFLLDPYLQEHGRTIMNRNIHRQVFRPKKLLPMVQFDFFSKYFGLCSRCFFNLLFYFSLFN